MTNLTQRPALRIAALLISLFIATAPEAFGQEPSNRDKLSLFVGAGWAMVPSSSGFLGGRTPREDHVVITGGAEFTPFSHLGFAMNVAHMRRNTAGDTFVSGDAVFHILVRQRVSPFVMIGVAHNNGPNTSASGLDIGVGTTIRISRHVSLRPELRSYEVHLLSSDPTILSMGIAYHW